MPPPTGQQFTNTPTEADTSRKYLAPKLQTAGWDSEPHSNAEQRQFTAGRTVVTGTKATRQKAKKVDYLLRYSPEMTLAQLEAKAVHKNAADELQQANNYAQILGLNFAFATNGKGIIEFDFLTGIERQTETFPSPDELWTRLNTSEGLTETPPISEYGNVAEIVRYFGGVEEFRSAVNERNGFLYAD